MSALQEERLSTDLGPIDFWVFDLDNTLYDVPPLMHAEIDRRMGTIMMYVIMMVVAFGIMNTFMMVILERVRSSPTTTSD